MLNYLGSNVGANPYIPVYATRNNNMNGNYNPTANTTKDSVVISSKKKKYNSHGGEALLAAGLTIAALIGVYKGHNKIAGVIKKLGEKKVAFQATHGNMTAAGVKNAGKSIGSSILNIGKSIIRFPKTLVKETAGIFKKTVK